MRSRILARTAAVAVAGAAAVALVSTPSQAITVPPPGHASLVIEHFLDPATGQIVGTHYLAVCPGSPLPPDTGIQTGIISIVSLPCPPTPAPGPFPV